MGNQYFKSSGQIKLLALSDNIEMIKELCPRGGMAFMAVHLILFHVNHSFGKYVNTS